MRHRLTAVVDFDGTIATYDKWKGEQEVGAPIKHARNALMELREWGWRIVIYTVRGNIEIVKQWMQKYSIPFDAINDCSHNPPGCSFKPMADVYFDDRDAHVVKHKPYNWRRAMKRVRKFYQPKPKTVEIDDASIWGSFFGGWTSHFSKQPGELGYNSLIDG